MQLESFDDSEDDEHNRVDFLNCFIQYLNPHMFRWKVQEFEFEFDITLVIYDTRHFCWKVSTIWWNINDYYKHLNEVRNLNLTWIGRKQLISDISQSRDMTAESIWEQDIIPMRMAQFALTPAIYGSSMEWSWNLALHHWCRVPRILAICICKSYANCIMKSTLVLPYMMNNGYQTILSAIPPQIMYTL